MSRAIIFTDTGETDNQHGKPPERGPPHPGKATPGPIWHLPAIWHHLHIEDSCSFQWRDVDAVTPEFPLDLHNTRSRVLSPQSCVFQLRLFFNGQIILYIKKYHAWLDSVVSELDEVNINKLQLCCGWILLYSVSHCDSVRVIVCVCVCVCPSVLAAARTRLVTQFRCTVPQQHLYNTHRGRFACCARHWKILCC